MIDRKHKRQSRNSFLTASSEELLLCLERDSFLDLSIPGKHQIVMIVICIEGCHGCGKTALCRAFEEVGYNILDEAFMDMPDVSLSPQCLTMEVAWLSNWFQRLVIKQTELKKLGEDRQQIFIADRSPFSAEFYASNGLLLGPVISHMIKEVKEQADVSIYTVYLKVDGDILWNRIQNRLISQPFRKKFKEDKREWMETTLKFYNNHHWDFVVTNNEDPILSTLDSALDELDSSVSKFKESSPPRRRPPTSHDIVSRERILQMVF